jgi:hypothetical protein
MWKPGPRSTRMRFSRMRVSQATTLISVVDHALEYVNGQIHTNGLENFWSLLKRGISGTYISVEPFHLFRYLDEQTFRYNHREGFRDGDRFDAAVRQVVGKRLTLDQLTVKNQPGVFLN